MPSEIEKISFYVTLASGETDKQTDYFPHLFCVCCCSDDFFRAFTDCQYRQLDKHGQNNKDAVKEIVFHEM